MTYAEFQAHWEREATSEYDGYVARPAAELLADFDPVELSAETRPDFAANLEAVETLLRRRLAKPPPPDDLTGT